MHVRWDPAQTVAKLLNVNDKTVRRWAATGWVEGRREGPRLLYVKVHAGGDLDGRPVGLAEHTTPQPGETA